ncbi:hypothetical protein XENOCAPTIV_030413 [Xenoophorus captivus]|uniref:Mitogen-activated protein kinase kinase kinase kinase 4 n=1 Tax=Xenoophorus captivus TaxID=1517983 RepID=A0ABV0RAQ7_9TELE
MRREEDRRMAEREQVTNHSRTRAVLGQSEERHKLEEEQRQLEILQQQLLQEQALLMEYKRKQLEEQRQSERLQRQLQQEHAYLVSLQQQQQQEKKPQLYHYNKNLESNNKPTWAREVSVCVSLCDQPTKNMSAFPTQDPSLNPTPRPIHSRELVRQNSDPTSETPGPQLHQIREDRGPWIRLPDVELPPKDHGLYAKERAEEPPRPPVKANDYSSSSESSESSEESESGEGPEEEESPTDR